MVEDLVAVGGFAEVYRGHDAGTNRPVALKLLPLSSEPDHGRRLLAEARAYARLQHPRIVALLEVGEHDGRPYLATEWVDGVTLSGGARPQPHATRQALEVMLQVADGLSAAHALGLAHRDLKPANIMVTPSGDAKILDFGLVRPVGEGELSERSFATISGTIVGTPAYMSPEQARGEPLGLATDVFSFGAVLAELLTGISPFKRDTVAETLNAVLTAPLPSAPRVPGVARAGLARLLARCLQRDPRRRFRDAREVYAALADLLHQPPRGRGWLGDPVLARATAAGIAILVAVVAGWALLRGRSPLPPSRGLQPLPVGGEAICLTPDGAEVVSRSGDGREIWLAPVGPGNPHLVWAAAGAVGGVAVTPDGHALLFDELGSSGTRCVWEVPITGGTPRRVTHGWSPAISSDGALVACFEETSQQLYRVALCRRDGSERRLLHELSAPLVPIAACFERGDRALLVSRTDGLRKSEVVRVHLGDGQAEILATEAGIAQAGLDLTPDGRAALWCLADPYSQHADLRAAPLGEGGARIVLPTTGYASCPSLSDDGQRLLIDLREGSSELVEVPGDPTSPARGVAYRVLPHSLDASQPRVSPDGTKVAFCSPRGDLWVLDRQRTSTAPLLATGSSSFNPAWSPDGRLLAYSCLSGPRSDLWIAAADGSDPRRLTDDPPADVHPVWHPDGRSIFFVSDRQGSDDLYRLDVPSGVISQITRDGALNPAVSPDGTLLATYVPRSRHHGLLRLSRMTPELDAALPVWERPVEGTTYAGFKPRFSPDGHWVAFDAPVSPVGADIFAVPVEGGGEAEPVRLTEFPFPVTTLGWFDWGRDGTLVVCLGRMTHRALLLHQASAWIDRALL